jgi:signal transduction histidine kinase
MVEDDGDGYDTEVINGSEGHGWKNIRSRIELMNGSVEIDSIPGKKGTTIIINVPLDNLEHSAHGKMEGSIGG